MLAHSMQKRQLPLQTRRNTRGRTSKKHPPFAFHLRSHFRDSFRKPLVFSARCLLHPVLQSFVKLKHILGKGIHGIRKTKCPKTLPNIIHRLIRWVQHVGCIKTVISQFVFQNFIGREIRDMTINLAQPLCCQQENSFTRVRLCVTKFGIPVRTHTKHDFQSPVNPSDFVEKTAIISQNFSDGQAFFLKQGRMLLVAIANNRFDFSTKAENMRRPQVITNTSACFKKDFACFRILSSEVVNVALSFP